MAPPDCSAAQRQQAVLEQFRAGELNTLISTAVAEEGLDLTRCALVRAGAALRPCPETPMQPQRVDVLLSTQPAPLSTCVHQEVGCHA